MSDFGKLTLDQVNDLGNKIGGRERAKRVMSGELVLVERASIIDAADQDNGGVTYAAGLDTQNFIEDLTMFYRDVYDLAVDLSEVPLPPYRQGFHWGVAVVPGMTNQRVYDEFAAERLMWKAFQNLDDAFTINDRDAATGSYVVWCRDRWEADREHKNTSANQLRGKVTTMTLLERQLLGRWFRWKTGGDLDVRSKTLCAGSRSSHGGVPDMCWYAADSAVGVGGSHPARADGFIRAREVVSL